MAAFPWVLSGLWIVHMAAQLYVCGDEGGLHDHFSGSLQQVAFIRAQVKAGVPPDQVRAVR